MEDAPEEEQLEEEADDTKEEEQEDEGEKGVAAQDEVGDSELAAGSREVSAIAAGPLLARHPELVYARANVQKQRFESNYLGLGTYLYSQFLSPRSTADRPSAMILPYSFRIDSSSHFPHRLGSAVRSYISLP